VSFLVPALADLVILGASADLLAASRAGLSRPRLTMVALGVGIAVTLTMNVASGSHHGIGGRLVNGWPALAFILALESLAGLVRRGRAGLTPLPPRPSSRRRRVRSRGGGNARRADDARRPDGRRLPGTCVTASAANPSYRGIGLAFGVHHDTVRQLVIAAGQAPEPESDEVPVPSLNGAGPHA